MLLAFQKAISWHQQSLYETRAFYEVKGGAANNEFGSMAFDKLWNLDSILLTFNLIFFSLKHFDSFSKC